MRVNLEARDEVVSQQLRLKLNLLRNVRFFCLVVADRVDGEGSPKSRDSQPTRAKARLVLRALDLSTFAALAGPSEPNEEVLVSLSPNILLNFMS
jgi:hypothetical protein